MSESQEEGELMGTLITVHSVSHKDYVSKYKREKSEREELSELMMSSKKEGLG